MKRNLRYIILVMSIGLAGIILFQAWWISNSYDLHIRTFRAEAGSLLEKALSQDLEAATLDQILRLRDSAGAPITIETERILGDSLSNLPDLSLRSDATPSSLGKYAIRTGDSREDQPERFVYIDKEDVNQILSSVVVNLANLHPDLGDLEKKYRQLLDEESIRTPFFLAYANEQEVYDLTGGSPGDFARAQAIHKLPGVNPDGEQVMAWFPETRSYILRGMWTTLLASILLVLVIAGSSVYMLASLVRQKKLSEIKNDFINNMTHELKTPISTVSAAMEAMVSFNAIDDREKSLRYIELSKRELARLSGMVENVLYLSTFEKEKLDLNPETFNLSSLLEETANQFLVQNHHRIQFDFNIPGPVYIHADKFHIQNVISNLYDNAIKYSQEEARIEVSCERNNELALFSVKDYGLGISREHQNQIFEKFYRVPTGDLHSVKGFGLGLSYVKQIVEAHGGTVGVKSQPGIGSEFTIALPVRFGI